MDPASIYGKMGVCTKGSGKEAKHPEKESSRGHLELHSKANSSRVGWRVPVLLSDPMGICIKVHGPRIENMATGKNTTVMGIIMKGTGRGIYKMDKGDMFGKMVMSMLVNGKMGIFMVEVF